MSFGDHLEELRRRLVLAIVGVVVGLVVCFAFKLEIMAWLIRPVAIALEAQGYRPDLSALQPAETFMVVFKMCALAGLVLASPWVIWQVWAFVSEGLYPREQKFVRRIAPVSIGLFVVGVLFLFYIVLPVVLSFLIGVGSWVPMPTLDASSVSMKLAGGGVASTQPVETEPFALEIPVLDGDPNEPASGQVWVSRSSRQLKVRVGDQTYGTDLRRLGNDTLVKPDYSLSFYISFVMHLAIGFGLGFQVPIVVVFLGVTGLVSVAYMASMRRYVIVIMVIVAALVTPPDVASQLLLAGPMVVLYELGLVAARMMVRRSGKGVEG